MTFPTGMYRQPVAQPAERLRLILRDGAELTVWRTGESAFESRRGQGTTWLGGYWSDLADLAAMLHCSRAAFIAAAERTFGVTIDPASGDGQMAWTYDSEQAVPKRIIDGGRAECPATGALHIVSWDAAMDLNGAAGSLRCLHCGELLGVGPN